MRKEEIKKITEKCIDTYNKIKPEFDEKQKEFTKEYGLEALKEMSEDETLEKLFGRKGTSGMRYKLINSTKYNLFGSANVTYDNGNDLRLKGDNWVFERKVITVTEAKQKANSYRLGLIDCLTEINEMIEKSEINYEKIENIIAEKLPIICKYLYIQKYFAIIYPNIFFYVYSPNYQIDCLEILEINSSTNIYLNHGKLVNYAKELGVNNLLLYLALKNELKIFNDKNMIDNKLENSNCDVPKNLILYGPPGTGKTYETVLYALAIVENKPVEEVKKVYSDYDDYIEKAMPKYQDYLKKGQIKFITFHQSYSYEEFIEGIKPNIKNEGALTYKLEDGCFKKFCNDHKNDKDSKYVFIIDEINRGNISRIFGELISLIEDGKRIGDPEERKVVLPYSKDEFGVPNNVYIIGTMNTADRSIALLDTALRRRFDFVELLPNVDLLNGISIEGIDIAILFKTINNRIEELLDREHTIGHSYFLKLRDESNQNLQALGKIFKNEIIPLLQEYFFDDYSKIITILSASNGSSKNSFIKEVDNKENSNSYGSNKRYIINEDAFTCKEAYEEIINKRK